jgi:hypothetical protein
VIAGGAVNQQQETIAGRIRLPQPVGKFEAVAVRPDAFRCRVDRLSAFRYWFQRPGRKVAGADGCSSRRRRELYNFCEALARYPATPCSRCRNQWKSDNPPDSVAGALGVATK